MHDVPKIPKVLDRTPTLFGGYIVNVNTNLSWGSQGASSQFTIVEDPKVTVIDLPPKYYENGSTACTDEDCEKEFGYGYTCNEDGKCQRAAGIINIPPMGSPVVFPYYETQLIENPLYDEVDNPNAPAFIEQFVLDENDEKIPQTFGDFSPDRPLVSGFLQRANYSESLSGRTYDIVIQSPATVLDGVQVILNKFNGSGLGGTLTNEVFNLMNVFGHYENLAVGGNYPFTEPWYNGFSRGGFGKSHVDNLGFPIQSTQPNADGSITTVNLFDTIVDMTRNPYYSAFGNPIRHGNYAYELDLTELYFAIDSRNLWYYRISGDVRDLGSLISEVCELLQFDWMAELRGPKQDTLTGNDRIYIRLMDRSFPPTAGVLKNFIAETYEPTLGDPPEANPQYGSVVSCSYGQELSTATTAKVILGAPVSRYVDQDIAECVPMFGRGTGDGSWQMARFPALIPMPGRPPGSEATIAHPRAGELMKTKDLYTMKNLLDPNFYFTLQVPGLAGDGAPGSYNVTLMELRMLTGKDPRRSWSTFKAFQTMAKKEPNTRYADNATSQQIFERMQALPWFTDAVFITDRDLEIMENKETSLSQWQDTNIASQRKRKELKPDFDKFFEGLSQIAESFCKHFMAPVPNDFEEYYYGLNANQIVGENVRFINTYEDAEAEQYVTSWEIKSDAWAMDPQVGRSDFFNNGRLKGMAAFSKRVRIPDSDEEWGNIWGDAEDFYQPTSNTSNGGPLPGATEEQGVNIRDLGNSWTYSRVFSSQQANPNAVPWDEFPGGAPSPITVPKFNPQTQQFQGVVKNPWGKGPGLKKILGADANILSLDGGPMEEQIYHVPDKPDPEEIRAEPNLAFPNGELLGFSSRRGAAFWVPCDAGASPLINDDLTNEEAGLSVLMKYFFNTNIHPSKYNAAMPYTQKAKDIPFLDPPVECVPGGCPWPYVCHPKENLCVPPKNDLFPTKRFDNLYFEVPPLRALPIGFGVPQQSTKYRYGPWTRVNAPNVTIPNPTYDSTDPDSPETILSYVSGKTSVEFDDSLAPETFGGYGGMNQAGFLNTEINTGRVAVDETGYVEFVGTPKYNLGEQFEGAGPYVTDLDVAVGVDGVTHTYKFNTWTPQAGKLAKYNIGIMQRIGKSSFKNILGAQNTASLMPTAGPLLLAPGQVATKQMIQNYQRTFRNSLFSFSPNSNGDINPPHMFTGTYYRLPSVGGGGGEGGTLSNTDPPTASQDSSTGFVASTDTSSSSTTSSSTASSSASSSSTSSSSSYYS